MPLAVGLATVSFLCAVVAAPSMEKSERPATLFGSTYPLEVAPSYPGALFHWVDCLAGTSVAKTTLAHREDYVRRFGRLQGEDILALTAFRRVRSGDALRAGRDPSRLLGIFCAADSVERALARAEAEIDRDSVEDLRRALDHFRPKYETVWGDGRQVSDFLKRSRDDRSRERLGRFLASMASFFGVNPASAPPPRVALVPVPDGHGTHAQAIGRELLIEIRPGDRLADQASVIVHENAHYLFGLIPEQKRRELEDFAALRGPSGETVWRLLREALPTALGQGVVDKMFRPGTWSLRNPWYHTADVDECAKTIYPLVNHVIANGRSFDEEFLLESIRRVDGRGEGSRSLSLR